MWPGHKILSKFQVQGQVAFFIFKTRTKYFGAWKNQAQERFASFKKVQARILCVNQAKRESSDSSIEQETQKYFEF